MQDGQRVQTKDQTNKSADKIMVKMHLCAQWQSTLAVTHTYTEKKEEKRDLMQTKALGERTRTIINTTCGIAQRSQNLSESATEKNGVRIYVCFPLLILRSEMFLSRRRYHLTTICPRDTYGSHLGLTWLSPKNII